MPPKVDPIILPPLRTYDRTGATRAAYSTQPSSNPLPTASTLFFQPATQSLVPSDVAAATPTQPPSPWYPLPFNPFIGEDTPSASIAASPTGRDYLPHTGPEVERSSRDDEGGGVALSGGNPAAAATGNFPGFHVPQRAFSTPSIQAYDSRNEGPRFSTSAHPLPHPGASSEAGKNIWDPDWLFQPQEKWNEHLRRLSTATVSPGTLATGGAEVQEQRAPQAIEPNVLAPGPTVDVRAQGAASSRQRNTTSRPSPPDHNLLTSYLQVMAQSAALRKTKTRARRTRRVKESSSAGNEGSNLPAGSQQEPGNDDEIGEGATSSNAGSASDATTGVTLPSFSRFIESAGLHQDMLPGYQWDPRGLSVREQRFLASTTNDQGGYEPFAPAGPLLDRRPLNLSAAGRDGLGNRTNSEAESTPEVDKPDTPAPMHIDTTQVVYPPDQTMSIVDQPKPARYSVETTHDPHLLPYRSVYPSVFQAQRQSQPPSFTPPQNSLHASSILSSASQIVPSPSQNQPRLSEPYPPSVVEQGRPKSRHSQFISTEDYGHVDHGSTHGYGANQGYGTTQSYNATQAYGATESHSVTQGYGSAQVYGSNSGQGVYEGSQEQGRRAPEYTYGQGSYANPPQSNVLRTGQGYGRNPFSNPQPQGRQRPQQQQPAYTHGQGNHNSYSARHPHPSVIPLHIPPNWNQQPGTYAASQAPYSAVPQIQPQPATYAPRALPLSGYPPFVAPYPVLPPFNIPAPTYRTHRARAAYNFRASHRLPVPPSLPIHRYRPGGDTMYPQSNGGASVAYQELTRRGRPSFAMGTRAENLPFVETARPARPARWGVAKIGNIPYSVTKQEILAFLGRNAKIITPDLGGAVHIIMERSTSKTMDCYVEFFSAGDALAAVNKFMRNRDDGRHPRIGDRHVTVELCGQDALMKELFPRAKNVIWHGGSPSIVESDDPYNSGFKGFVTSEEMVMLVKHAEQPHRSPFSQRCLQRTYECMISTLEKYPWWCVALYTLADRDLLFWATEQQIKMLVIQIKRGGAPGLTSQLLVELVYSGLNAPGFSESQRAALLAAAEWAGTGIRLSPLAAFWPFKVLGRKTGIGEDVVEYYATLLHEATTSSAFATLAEQSASDASWTEASPFGHVTVPWPADHAGMTMAAAAELEWGVLEGLLKKVLGGSAGSSVA